MKVILCLLLLSAAVNAGHLGYESAHLTRDREIDSVTALLQIIGQYFLNPFRPPAQSGTGAGAGAGTGTGTASRQLTSDELTAILTALYGGSQASGYSYAGVQTLKGQLSPELTAALVSGLYGNIGQQIQHVSEDVKTIRVITENKLSGHSAGAQESHGAYGNIGGAQQGGYNYGKHRRL